jgi:hypothetical protein
MVLFFVVANDISFSIEFSLEVSDHLPVGLPLVLDPFDFTAELLVSGNGFLAFCVCISQGELKCFDFLLASRDSVSILLSKHFS